MVASARHVYVAYRANENGGKSPLHNVQRGKRASAATYYNKDTSKFPVAMVKELSIWYCGGLLVVKKSRG